MMFVALAVFIVASVLCALAPTIEMLTLARVLQGLGGGGLMTLSQALIGEAMPPRERARYQGYLAAVAMTANSFGPVAGGYLTEHFGWQSIFLVNVPIGLGRGRAHLRAFAYARRAASRGAPTPGGLVLFAMFVATTLLALEQAQHVDLGALPVAWRAAGRRRGRADLLVRHENRAPSPLIPLGLLRLPAIWRSDAMAAFHGAALVSLVTFLPVYLEVVRGASPSETGLLLVPLTLGIGTGSLLTGRLVHKTGLTTVFPVIGLALVTINLLVLALWASRSTHGSSPSAAAAVERLVHRHGDGRGAGDGAERRRAAPAGRGGGLGAVLALDRRGLRHRAGRHRAVRHAGAEETRNPRASSPPWSKAPATP